MHLIAPGCDIEVSGTRCPFRYTLQTAASPAPHYISCGRETEGGWCSAGGFLEGQRVVSATVADKPVGAERGAVGGSPEIGSLASGYAVVILRG
jgi:hypothetical protein